MRAMALKGEKIFHGKKDIKYLYKRSEASKHLIVVFSGYSIHQKLKAVYNYINVLENCEINRLFILDSYGYDSRGCWYLGEGGKHDVEESVIDLINNIIQEEKFDKNNVILMGSSKGGFASLYFGVKYNFPHIITASPQIYLGKYFTEHLKHGEEIMNSIIPKDDSNRIDKLNNLIQSNVTKGKDTKIYIYCGVLDSHLNEQVLPFINDNKDILNIYLELVQGDHSRIGREIERRLPSIIKDIVNGNNPIDENLTLSDRIDSSVSLNDIGQFVDINNIKVRFEEGKLISTMNSLNLNYKYACYLYKDDEVIEKQFYKRNPNFEFAVDIIGKYMLVWYIEDMMKNHKILYVPIYFNVSTKKVI